MTAEANVDHPLPDTAATGEMAALVNAKDWSRTLLGSRETWSPSLRMIAATILASQFPMAVRWGPDLVQIYNDGYRPILGEKHPDALGLPFREAWPETQAQVGAVHDGILAGERGAFFSEDLPLRVRRRGDELEDAFFTISYSPVFDDTAASGVGGVLVTAVETTLRVWVERALRRLNETLEQQVADRTRERDRLWRVSDDLIGVANFEGYWAAINPAATAILGWSEAELLSMPIASLWHPDDVAFTLAQRDKLVHGGPTVRFQNRYRHKDGSYRWLSWSSTAEEGFIYALARDVTALRRTEEQLRQAQKMEAVGQLTGGIAHDFNNLLTGVIGSLDLMKKRIAQGRIPEVERYVSLATASANRAAALTHRLLAFSRRQPIDPKPVDASRLIRSLEELLRRTIGEAIELEIVARGDLWATFCDPNQLENSLLNLVINSRDAMPDGGRLTIEAANVELDNPYAAELSDVTPGQYVCLAVADTGVGMSPTVQARAFDPFFTTKPMGQGTGLGLSMTYGFALQSEGHVRIHSEPGRGTTVRLYLPRYRGAVDEASAAAGTTALPKAQAGETVLVIEDEGSVRALVTDVLHDLGYRALEANDGPSGLKILQSSERIDLLVSDIGLPGMNGRQVAEAARAHRPDLKVLFITGYAENAAMAEGFLAPGMEMVTKPFAVDALAARIREMIAS